MYQNKMLVVLFLSLMSFQIIPFIASNLVSWQKRIGWVNHLSTGWRVSFCFTKKVETRPESTTVMDQVILSIRSKPFIYDNPYNDNDNDDGIKFWSSEIFKSLCVIKENYCSMNIFFMNRVDKRKCFFDHFMRPLLQRT